MIHKSVSLHNDQVDRNGAKHDKVYYLQIVDGTTANTYSVSFQYGKRGGALKWGNRDGSLKCENVSMWQAERYLDDKVSKQLAKGYHVIPDPIDLLTLISFTF